MERPPVHRKKTRCVVDSPTMSFISMIDSVDLLPHLDGLCWGVFDKSRFLGLLHDLFIIDIMHIDWGLSSYEML